MKVKIETANKDLKMDKLESLLINLLMKNKIKGRVPNKTTNNCTLEQIANKKVRTKRV
jgi:hypothetical protein